MRVRASGLRYAALVPAALALAVFGFTTGSSSVPLFFQEGGKQARWVGLALLLAVSAGWSISVGRRRVLLTRRFAPVVALAALAVASAAWSVEPRVGGARAISLLLLFAAAGALAHASAGSMAARRVVAIGLVAGCAVVVVGGLFVLAFAPDYAVQWGTTQTPFRYRGLGINPNTVPLLLAVCLPLALWAAVDANGRGQRVLAWLVVSAFVAQIVASGSRGAALASVLSLVGSTVVLDRSRGYRATAAAAVVVLLGYGFVLREVVTPTPPLEAVEPFVVPISQRPKPTPAGERPEPTGAGERPEGQRPAPTGPGRRPGGRRPDPPTPGKRPEEGVATGAVDEVRLFYVRRQDEIGHPLLGTSSNGGGLLGGSGRLSVFPEVIRTISRRPLLGYGFGTESQTFTDRWYVFDGGLPENSYLGWVLQLGIVGLGLFLAVGAVLAVVARRALRDRDGPERRLVAAFALTAFCGFVLAVFQSYVYSVGNVAALPFWVAVFMLLASGVPARGMTSDSDSPVGSGRRIFPLRRDARRPAAER